MKITEKVSFNTASEVSYVFIWVDKCHFKIPKMVNLSSFENLKLVVKQYCQTGQFLKDKT